MLKRTMLKQKLQNLKQCGTKLLFLYEAIICNWKVKSVQ